MNSQDPIFQLNLMIWLAWYPLINYDLSGIRPIFRKEGYELHAIAPLIIFPLQNLAKANHAKLPVNRSASPDLVIKHHTNKHLVPIECKINSFGPNSNVVQQAYILLSATGPQMAGSFGLDSPEEWNSFLLYGLEADNHISLLPTLNELSQNLQKSQIEAISMGTLGIRIDNARVYLQAISQETIPIGALDDSSINQEWIEVMNFEDTGDPSLLNLLPIDPSIQTDDEKGTEILNNKIRSSITSCIGSKLDDENFIVTEDEIMMSAIEVWSIWRDENAKHSLMKQVRDYLRNILSEIRSSQEIKSNHVKIDYSQRRISFSGVTVSAARAIRRYFESASYRRGDISSNPPSSQLNFGDISDKWT